MSITTLPPAPFDDFDHNSNGGGATLPPRRLRSKQTRTDGKRMISNGRGYRRRRGEWRSL